MAKFHGFADLGKNQRSVPHKSFLVVQMYCLVSQNCVVSVFVQEILATFAWQFRAPLHILMNSLEA
jgi:hypothetical protein